MPSILANITIPLVGIVDTAIVGHLSDAAAPVRLEISDVFSRDALDYICRKLKLKNVRVFTSRIPLDLSYLYTLQEYDTDPRLHYVPRSPRKPAALSDTRPVFQQVKSKDILLSYPFESINLSFIRLLQESANDPKVVSIKITLYRLARNSKVIDALCTAAEQGKEVLVMIELRARFDEENNIEWSKQLQEAGGRRKGHIRSQGVQGTLKAAAHHKKGSGRRL